MVNTSPCPTLLDNCLTLSITKLRELGYLIDNQIVKGGLYWENGGDRRIDILFEINTKESPTYIELNYQFEGQSRMSKIGLIKVESNIGKGSYFYFLCPSTGKRCRILYFVKGYFLHREAIKGGFYKKQIQSKKQRGLLDLLESAFIATDILETLDSRYFRASYKGEPTKRLSQLEKKTERIKSLFTPISRTK